MMAGTHVVIIGGGLAGMTVAKSLADQGDAKYDITILEGSGRLGGKAGADRVNGMPVDHGYHIFPMWYLNTRAILRDLGIEHDLIPINAMHHVAKGQLKNPMTLHAMSVRNLWRNLNSGLVSLPQGLLAMYFLIDLMAQSFKRSSYLDRVSINGFMRSRRYATETMAKLNQSTVLQASSIPGYEISAKVGQKVVGAWTAEPTPAFSILPGDLQTHFIDPFEQRLCKVGVKIEKNCEVQQFRISGRQVIGIEVLRVRSNEAELIDGTEETVYVLATALAEAIGLATPDVYRAEQLEENLSLEKLVGNLAKLETAPMAALHLPLKRTIDNMPKEHVLLRDSGYLTSFIDLSQHWKEFEHTTLSVIASNLISIVRLPEDEIQRKMIDEIQAFIPDIKDVDIDWPRVHLLTNVKLPLFLNTVGAWQYRPRTKTRLDNLYIAGDYCQSEADLTTMESAIQSALSTAQSILQSNGQKDACGPEPLELPDRRLMLALKYVLWPFAMAIRAGLGLSSRKP